MKRLIIIFLLALCLVLVCVCASANSWGLKGALLNAVSSVHTWDDYSSLSSQAGDYAVMHSRYHNALFWVDGEKNLHVYTKAVYQPEDQAKGPNLTWKDDVLTLSYGSGEEYRFSRENSRDSLELLEARIGDFRVWRGEGTGFSYYAEDASGKTVFRGWNPLASFNIRLFPRSVEEVQRINRLTAYLGDTHVISGGYTDDPGILTNTGKKGTAPVLSAPFKGAWRAGKGKAAVGLAGELWTMPLMDYRNDDGESYTLVRYNVSERTQRIGWVLSRDLGQEEKKEQVHEPLYDFCRVDVRVIADTYLTDDPDVSQYAHFQVPKDTLFTCLGQWGEEYAYVEAEVKNGKFVDGGAVIWGFVPLRDLEIMDEGEALPEVMERLVGIWSYDAGGSFGPDVISFADDGTFTSNLADWSLDVDGNILSSSPIGGTWKVIPYSVQKNLFWDNPQYALVLQYDNGAFSVNGLSFDEEGFGLTGGEGGGGYIPAGPEQLENLFLPYGNDFNTNG